METEIKKLDKLKHTIKVEVKGPEFLAQKKTAYAKCSKNLKVPGFRPGNAPEDILEKHHAKFLQEEFLKNSLPYFYQKALEENKISPAGLPRIYDIELKADFLSFSAEFEAKPTVEVQDSYYKGIKIKSKKPEVKDEEIKKVLTNLREGIKKVFTKEFSDQDLAKWASYSDLDNFNQAIKGQLFTEKLRERRQVIENQVRQHLLKSFKFALPSSEVQRHHQELVNREVYNLQSRGLPKEDIDKYRKELEDKCKPMAQDEVKLFYILEAIANREGIKVDNSLADVVLGFVLSQAKYE
jgi:FKBP-type peptidyl-prolyl cis-trans isomerase (trigger factor)